MISAYRHRDRVIGGQLLKKIIDDLSHDGPNRAPELGRLEHLRGSALNFRNLTNYIARSLLETGGFRPL